MEGCIVAGVEKLAVMLQRLAGFMRTGELTHALPVVPNAEGVDGVIYGKDRLGDAL